MVKRVLVLLCVVVALLVVGGWYIVGFGHPDRDLVRLGGDMVVLGSVLGGIPLGIVLCIIFVADSLAVHKQGLPPGMGWCVLFGAGVVTLPGVARAYEGEYYYPRNTDMSEPWVLYFALAMIALLVILNVIGAIVGIFTRPRHDNGTPPSHG